MQAELERLYALPPPAFTAARNQLAVRLRQEGRRDAAATVKALPRPTPSSWAVSRLMRLEPARFQALLAAGRQARQAQRQVVGGGSASGSSSGARVGPAARLREALQGARSLIEELRRRGLELLAASGRPASAASAERLGADLQALAFTAGAERAIERGWFDGDLDAPGFEVLAGLQAAAGPAPARTRAHPGKPSARPAPSRRAPAREHAAGQEATVGRRAGQEETAAPRRAGPKAAGERRRADQDEARRRLQLERERRQERLEEAEAEVRRAAAESDRLDAAAAAALAAATDARRRAAEAQREAERAGRGAEQARRQLDRARERQRAVRAAAEPGLKASRAGALRADETR